MLHIHVKTKCFIPIFFSFHNTFVNQFSWCHWCVTNRLYNFVKLYHTQTRYLISTFGIFFVGLVLIQKVSVSIEKSDGVDMISIYSSAFNLFPIRCHCLTAHIRVKWEFVQLKMHSTNGWEKANIIDWTNYLYSLH